MAIHNKIITIPFKVAICCLLLLPITIRAQQPDTLSALRQYLDISNAYKHIPMHASVELHNSTSFISAPTDTATTAAEFYFVKNGVYMKFGEMEQLVNDSLLLLVSNNAKHMILVTNKTPISTNLKNYMGVKMEDSSIQKIANKYVATVLPEQSGIITIEVKSRQILYGTSQPREVVIFRYKEKTGMPIDITQTSSLLIDLDSSQFNDFSRSAQNIPYLIKQQGSFYLMKQKVVAFIYKQIDYGDKITMPANINDRIVKDVNGEYIPAKGYETFKLTSRI